MGMNDKQRESLMPKWLEWAREIQALAQTGLHFAENHYQSERCTRLLEIAAEIISDYSDLEKAELIEIYTNQVGYATPRIDVRGAVFQNGKLMLPNKSRKVKMSPGLIIVSGLTNSYVSYTTGPIVVKRAKLC